MTCARGTGIMPNTIENMRNDAIICVCRYIYDVTVGEGRERRTVEWGGGGRSIFKLVIVTIRLMFLKNLFLSLLCD